MDTLKEFLELLEDADVKKRGHGRTGAIIIISDDNSLVGKLAKALGVKSDGKVHEVTKSGIFVTYKRKDRLTIYEHLEDMEAETQVEESIRKIS